VKKSEVIYDDVKKLIVSSVFNPGDQLPPESAYMTKYAVSRPTVAKAIRRLEAEGLISRSPGLGTFVREISSASTRQLLFGIAFPEFGRGEIFDPITNYIAGLGKHGNFSLLWGGAAKDKSHVFSVDELTELFNEYIKRKVDGVFFAPLEGLPDAHIANQRGLERLSGAGIPVVLIDRDFSVFPVRSAYPLIGIDNFRAGYTITHHYLSQKADRIDFVWLPYKAYTVGLRIKGYQSALADHNIRFSADWLHFGHPEDTAFAKSILDSGARNLICGNDENAALLMNTLREMNVEIPGELRLAAFDDVKYGRLISVPLTTMHQPIQEIARRSVAEMMRLLLPEGQGASDSLFLQSDLIIRKSSLIS